MSKAEAATMIAKRMKSPVQARLGCLPSDPKWSRRLWQDIATKPESPLPEVCVAASNQQDGVSGLYAGQEASHRVFEKDEE